MTLSLHSLAVDTFVPMLRSLSDILGKGAQHSRTTGLAASVLPNARLAPDMYPLSKQIQLACDQADGAAARLAGKEAAASDGSEQTLEELQARIARTIAQLEALTPAATRDGDTREISIPLPIGGAIVMNGVQFVRDWALPHFYFHVVTAYDILRHNGVEIGKRDYLSGVAKYIRPAK